MSKGIIQEKTTTKAEQIILNYTASWKWSQIKKLKWTTAEIMDIFDSYFKERTSQVKKEECLLAVLEKSEELQNFKDQVKNLGTKLRKVDAEIRAAWKDDKYPIKKGFELSKLRSKLELELQALAVSE